MKKILFYAGLLAVAAGCSQDEFDSVGGSSQVAKGITFEAGLAETAATKGEYGVDETGYPFSWNAEWDKITIYGDNVSANTENTAGNGVVSNWNSLPNSGASYRATTSGGKGRFTANGDENWIMFNDADETANKETNKYAGISNFVALYNATLAEVTPTDANNTAIGSVKVSVQANNAQTVSASDASLAKYTPLLSVSQAAKTFNLQSVGENVNLNFFRVLPGVRFLSEGIDEDMAKLFGKLESVTLVADGYQGETPIAALSGKESKIGYSSVAEVTVDFENGNVKTIEDDKTADKSEVKLTYTNGIEFKDGVGAFMIIAPVDRSAYRTAKVKETMVAKFAFENIDLQVSGETNSDWSVNTTNLNGFIPMPALDMDAYPYLLTKVNKTAGGETYCLIINSGTIADALVEGETDVIDWNDEEINFDKIVKIRANVELPSTDIAMLSSFDNLTEVVLKENTSLPKNTFKAAQAAKIETLELDKVTSIDPEFSTKGEFSKLTTLVLPAYNYENETVNGYFLLNDATNSELVTLDMSAVESMMPTFGVQRTLSFKGFTTLKEVTVGDGVVVSPNAFNECTSLAIVNGVVDITEAVGAFEGCNSTNFTTINVSGTVIPDNAFKKASSVKNVLYNKAQVVPTAVGESAFEGTAVEKMNLQAAATIGANAFKNASSYVGNGKNAVLNVAATVISEGAFEGTGLTGAMINFTNATRFEKNIFKNVTGQISQIKFSKVLSGFAEALGKNGGANNHWQNTFKNADKIDLFVNPAQTEFVNGTALVLPAQTDGDGKVIATGTITFKTLQKKN